jgi:hypothetical protein
MREYKCTGMTDREGLTIGYALLLPWLLLLYRYAEGWCWLLGGLVGVAVSVGLACLAEYQLEGLGRYVGPRQEPSWNDIKEWWRRNVRWLNLAAAMFLGATIFVNWSLYGTSRFGWLLLYAATAILNLCVSISVPNMIVEVSRRRTWVMQGIGSPVFYISQSIGPLYIRLSDYDYWCFGWEAYWKDTFILSFGYSSLAITRIRRQA